MRGLLVVLLLAGPLLGQAGPTVIGPCKMDGSDCSSSGSSLSGLTSGRVTLSTGATTVGDDAGCTWTGTGASFVATFGGGVVVGSEAALFNTFKGANSDGPNLFIGGGGQSSVGAIGGTYKGSGNTSVGIGAGQANTTGYSNTFVGNAAGTSTTTGFSNIHLGAYAGQYTTVGNSNVAIGVLAAQFNDSGSGLVAIGNAAGRYETGGNAFYVNNVSQGSTAGDKAYSLLYGTFAGSAGTKVGNTLTVNGKIGIDGQTVWLSSPSSGVALFEDGAGDPRDVQARTIQGPGITTTLTESSASPFATLAFAASTVVSARLICRVEANDGTDYQVLTGLLLVSSVRKATGNTVSTVSVLGTAGEITAGGLLAASAGTLTCAYTVTEGAASATVNANCVSSLTQTTLRLSFQAITDGPAVTQL